MLFYKAHRKSNPLKDSYYWAGEVGIKEKNAYFKGMAIGFSFGVFVVVASWIVIL